MWQELRASLVVLLIISVLTGLLYPVVMTAMGQRLMPFQANGSLIERDGKIIGSALIGQVFTSPIYFHARPSAAGTGYDANNSAASNLAPSAPDLVKTLAMRVTEWRKTGDIRPIPIDLITTSGSGLDPDISVAAARYQAPAVAVARHMAPRDLETLIADQITGRSLSILGENRVNVLAINQKLDKLFPVSP